VGVNRHFKPAEPHSPWDACLHYPTFLPSWWINDFLLVAHLYFAAWARPPLVNSVSSRSKRPGSMRNA